MSRVLFCPRCGWESVALSDDLARRALAGGLARCHEPSCTPFNERIQSRRVREIGVPESPAPKVAGTVGLPVGVRPAGVPDVEREKRDALTRLYRRLFGKR